MIPTLDLVDRTALQSFGAIIDVRSPAEFADDHVPGAVNLPVLNNAERAEVGTIYVQQSRLLARRIGAAYVARNIAAHLEGPVLSQVPSAFAPLVYCWRGGQRSNAMATVLSQVGWRPTLIAGGYKTYRRQVTAALYDAEPPYRFVLLDGHTGTAKTEILARLSTLGVQTLDLEALAAHRGSLFGALPGQPQPSQRMFESRLLAAIEALDMSRPIVVEAESSKIGERFLPTTVWKAMLAAPRITLQAQPEARARYLACAYADIAADRDALQATLDRLPRALGRKRLDAWRALADAGEIETLAASLIETHYDPAYTRSSRKDGRRTLGVVELAGLDGVEQARAAEAVAEMVCVLRDAPLGAPQDDESY
jgi:tRNA 2-selenouridine synthase